LVPTFRIGAGWCSADRFSGRWGGRVRLLERRHNRRSLGGSMCVGSFLVRLVTFRYNGLTNPQKRLKWICGLRWGLLVSNYRSEVNNLIFTQGGDVKCITKLLQCRNGPEQRVAYPSQNRLRVALFCRVGGNYG